MWAVLTSELRWGMKGAILGGVDVGSVSHSMSRNRSCFLSSTIPPVEEIFIVLARLKVK